MKKQILFTLIAATMASGVNAGVAETKAMRSADTAIAESVTKTKAACGNAALEVNVAWDQVEAVTEKNAELITKKNSKPAYVISEIGGRTAAALEALQKICTEDADYKDAISKMSKVEVTPKDSYDDYVTEFALEGDTLKITNGFYMTRTASDFMKRIKELY